MSSRRMELAAWLRKTSIEEGTFTLASGDTATQYLDVMHCWGTQGGSDCLVQAFIERISKYESRMKEVEAVGGPADKGSVIAVTFREAMHNWLQIPLNGFFVRKEPKTHGIARMITGPAPMVFTGLKCLLIEDVITRGNTVLRAMRELYALGCNIVGVVCVVDRSDGSIEEAIKRVAEEAAARSKETSTGGISADVLYLPLLFAADLGLREVTAQQEVTDELRNTSSPDRLGSSGDGNRDVDRHDSVSKVSETSRTGAG